MEKTLRGHGRIAISQDVFSIDLIIATHLLTFLSLLSFVVKIICSDRIFVLRHPYFFDFLYRAIFIWLTVNRNSTGQMLIVLPSDIIVLTSGYASLWDSSLIFLPIHLISVYGSSVRVDVVGVVFRVRVSYDASAAPIDNIGQVHRKL